MAKTPKLYTRLTRATPALASYKSLWLAADHVLVLNSTGYHEEYRRIHFRDIQGFFMTASERRGSWALFWAIWAGVSGLVMASGFIMESRPVVSGVFCGIGVMALLWNYLLGPGCVVYVVTRVQTQPLPSLVRIKKARKVLARLTPLIAAAQANLTAKPVPSTPLEMDEPPVEPTPQS